MRGPFGLARTAATRVEGTRPPDQMFGAADVGARTHARVTWTLAPAGGGTEVTLAAEVERDSALDRLLLAAGGRRWLERRFQEVLEALAERLAPAAAGSERAA